MQLFAGITALGGADHRPDQVIISAYGPKGGTTAIFGLSYEQAADLRNQLVAMPQLGTPTFNDRELSTVIAALRAIQNVQQHEALAPEIEDIATDGGRYVALDHDEIDALCARLNGHGA
jgi:hypothetical protein